VRLFSSRLLIIFELDVLEFLFNINLKDEVNLNEKFNFDGIKVLHS